MKSLYFRINNMFNAKVRKTFEAAEDPHLAAKEVIYQMEDQIRIAKNHVVNAISCEKQLSADLDRHQRDVEKWLAKAKSALESGNEDMAKTALTYKVESQKNAEDLKVQVDKAKRNSELLKKKLKDMVIKVKDYKHRQLMLTARQKTANAKKAMNQSMEDFHSTLDLNEEFNRLEDRVLEMETTTDAMLEIEDEREIFEADMNKLEIQETVEKEFSILKQDCGQ